MKVPCMKEYGRIKGNFGTEIATGRRYVTVYAGICDSCDLCGDKSCAFYNDTVEGTRRFKAVSAKIHASLEARQRDKEEEEAFLASCRGMLS